MAVWFIHVLSTGQSLELLMSTGINADRKIFNERNFETEKNKFTIEIQLKVEANYKSN